MKVESSRESRPAGQQDVKEDAGAARAPYQPPRIVKKRAVSRATLFTGTGPDTGGIFGSSS